MVAQPKSTVQELKKIKIRYLKKSSRLPKQVEILVASSGLSIQYAILMGLIHEAKETLNTKKIQIIVPTIVMGVRMIRHDELLTPLMV